MENENIEYRHHCWNCGHELIWQCDYDLSDYGIDDREGIVTTWYCSGCGADYEAYFYFDGEGDVEKNNGDADEPTTPKGEEIDERRNQSMEKAQTVSDKKEVMEC